MIDIFELVKSYNGHKVLNEISFSVKHGEIVSIIGPSGGGKSTVLRCIKKIEQYDSGYIKLNVVKDYQVGMVFQNFNLFNNMSVLKNLCYAPINVMNEKPLHAKRLAREMLERVGLADYEKTFPIKLSGGQKQRVAIARTLCMNPQIILFDEPTSALDIENVAEVLKVIRSIASAGNITMIIVTHEIRFASSISDRIIFLENGRILEDTTTKEFFTNQHNERTRQFLEKIVT